MIERVLCGHIMTLNPKGVIQERLEHAVAIDSVGRIAELGPKHDILQKFPDAEHIDFGDDYLLPGFLDLHSHPPQLEIMGRYGDQLLEWLLNHTYPMEVGFADVTVAEATVSRYLDWQLRCGITTGVWYATSSLQATERVLDVVDRAGVRAIVGKVSMDQHGPKDLLVPADQDLAEWHTLIAKWRGKSERIQLALTPRFAPSCSKVLLENLGRLAEEHRDLYIQTHLSENQSEIELAAKTHTGHEDYAAIYEAHGLLGGRTLLAHCIHLSEREIQRLRLADCAVAHCPTSNLFLGSGLYPLKRHRESGLSKIGIGTDIGAGTTLCMWETLRATYGISHLQGYALKPAELFGLVTKEGARALGREQDLGGISTGFQGDIQVLKWRDGGALERQWESADGPEERLCALLTHAGSQHTQRVYCQGKEVWARRRRDI